MNYWRMQLHPSDPAFAADWAANSLAAGFIGLGFPEEVEDLALLSKDGLPSERKDYWDFAHSMSVGDRVLVICHHFPFALCTIAGDYNYIREPVPEIGVWFPHFRRVKDITYYADRVTNAHEWQRLVMTDTISILKDTGSASYSLIEDW